MNALGMPTAGAMDLPFVPFTFPTVLFSRLMREMGYDPIPWGRIDAIWSAYSRGLRDGAIAGGLNSESRNYLVGKGFSDRDVSVWLSVAQEAADRFWGQGSYFATFGGSPGVMGAFSGVVQGAVDLARSVGDAVLGGAARALGLPKWLAWALGLMVFALVLWFVAGRYFPAARRAFR